MTQAPQPAAPAVGPLPYYTIAEVLEMLPGMNARGRRSRQGLWCLYMSAKAPMPFRIGMVLVFRRTEIDAFLRGEWQPTPEHAAQGAAFAERRRQQGREAHRRLDARSPARKRRRKQGPGGRIEWEESAGAEA